MATVTKTIGSNDRDYATISAWEADLDNSAIYNAGDDAIGVLYDDSVYEFSAQLTIDNGNTVGLSSVSLTVSESSRHNGTAGTGVILRLTSATTNRIIDMATTNWDNGGVLEWVEVDCNNGQLYNGGIGSSSHTVPAEYATNWFIGRNILVYDGKYRKCCIGTNNTQTRQKVYNCIVYAMTSSSADGADSTSIGNLTNVVCHTYNNTVHNVGQEGTGHNAYGIGIYDGGANVKVQNNLATNTGDQSFNVLNPSNATADHNGSSDTSATGTGSIRNIVPSGTYTSTVVGSENLILLETSRVWASGTDVSSQISTKDTLGTTIIDIWHIGSVMGTLGGRDSGDSTDADGICFIDSSDETVKTGITVSVLPTGKKINRIEQSKGTGLGDILSGRFDDRNYYGAL